MSDVGLLYGDRANVRLFHGDMTDVGLLYGDRANVQLFYGDITDVGLLTTFSLILLYITSI